MKPIKNTTQSMFQIGRTFRVMDLDIDYEDREEVTIFEIMPCNNRCVCAIPPKYRQHCEGMQFRDERTDLWCAIPEDFELVTESESGGV
jgi:hypothetical protein